MFLGKKDIITMNYNSIICGHAAQVMSTWPDKCIDLIVTSPPYWQSDDGKSYESYILGLAIGVA